MKLLLWTLVGLVDDFFTSLFESKLDREERRMRDLLDKTNKSEEAKKRLEHLN